MPTAAELKLANKAVIQDSRDAYGGNGPADIVARLDAIVDALVAVYGPAPPILLNVSLLDQSGTDDVMGTQLNSNFTSGIDRARTEVGKYTGTLTGEMVGAFSAPTAILIGTLQTTGLVRAFRFSDDVLKVETYNLAGAATDGLLVNTAIDIRIYAALE